MTEPYLVIPCDYSDSADRAVAEYVMKRMDVAQIAADQFAWAEEVAFDAAGKIVRAHLTDGQSLTIRSDGSWTKTSIAVTETGDT